MPAVQIRVILAEEELHLPLSEPRSHFHVGPTVPRLIPPARRKSAVSSPPQWTRTTVPRPMRLNSGVDPSPNRSQRRLASRADASSPQAHARRFTARRARLPNRCRPSLGRRAHSLPPCLQNPTPTPFCASRSLSTESTAQAIAIALFSPESTSEKNSPSTNHRSPSARAWTSLTSSPSHPEPKPAPTTALSSPTRRRPPHRGQPSSAAFVDHAHHSKVPHPPLLLSRLLDRWIRR